MPIWYAFSSNSDIGFKLKTISCYSCAHKKENEPKEPKPGESQLVYPIPVDGVEALPPRSDYFEREAAAHMAEHAREEKRREQFAQQN